jgi:hypothetical protein
MNILFTFIYFGTYRDAVSNSGWKRVIINELSLETHMKGDASGII